jgi:hypothetical protein
MEAKILGVFEKIDFPEFNIKNIKAKIDSGAYTGALHCTTVVKEQTSNGAVIHFSPFDYPDIKITTKDFRMSHVKSSNGKREKRYFIKTSVTIQDETYEIQLSLADRSQMKWPVIIGRRFIRKHKFLLDANKKPSAKRIADKIG